jgi:hypothetical protein
MKKRPIMIGIVFFFVIISLGMPGSSFGKDEAVGLPLNIQPGDVNVKPGDVITWQNKGLVRNLIVEPYFPLMACEKMKMDIVKTVDYVLHPKFVEVTKKFGSQTKLSPKGELVDFVCGYPFDPAKLDKNDPQLGIKLAWNFDYRWQKGGPGFDYWRTNFYKKGTLFRSMVGDYQRVWYSGRADLWPERTTLMKDGSESDLQWKEFLEMHSPFDLRGIKFLMMRYVSASKEDDTYSYLPTMRRVRRLSIAQRSDSMLGMEHTFDDFSGNNAKIPSWNWKYVGETKMLVVADSKVRGYPYVEHLDMGPSGISIAVPEDNWQMRDVWVVEGVPKPADHPYSKKVLFFDKQTFAVYNTITWDRKGETYKCWVVPYYWTENPDIPEKVSHGVQAAISSSLHVFNVQTGVTNAIEWSDNCIRDFSPEQAKTFFDFGRLQASH